MTSQLLTVITMTTYYFYDQLIWMNSLVLLKMYLFYLCLMHFNRSSDNHCFSTNGAGY